MLDYWTQKKWIFCFENLIRAKNPSCCFYEKIGADQKSEWILKRNKNSAIPPHPNCLAVLDGVSLPNMMNAIPTWISGILKTGASSTGPKRLNSWNMLTSRLILPTKRPENKRADESKSRETFF